MEIKTHKLTKEQIELLTDIQNSSMDIFGFSASIKRVLAFDTYDSEDKEWLNELRYKWIEHLKEIKQKDELTQWIIENTKSY